MVFREDIDLEIVYVPLVHHREWPDYHFIRKVNQNAPFTEPISLTRDFDDGVLTFTDYNKALSFCQTLSKVFKIHDFYDGVSVVITLGEHIKGFPEVANYVFV